jgi:hypothetical protein
MNKKLLFISLAVAIALIAPSQLLVQAQPTGVETAPDIPILGANGVLERIIDALFTISLLVAAIFIVIAAFFFITSNGEPEKISKAKISILYTLIGVLVAFSAKGLVMLMQNIAQ